MKRGRPRSRPKAKAKAEAEDQPPPTTLTAAVAEAREREEALTRERQFFTALMDTIPDAIYFKDEDSRFLRVNRAWADRVGLDDPAAADGRTDFD